MRLISWKAPSRIQIWNTPLMFIFTMSCFRRPYFVSNSSSKMASSNVFEHRSPMLNRNGFAVLPTLRCHITGSADDWHDMPTRASRSSPRARASCDGEGVCRVRVATAGRRQDLVVRHGDAGLGLPVARLTVEVRHEGAVDVVVLAQPHEHRRDEPTVLAHPVDRVVAGPGEQQVLVDARRLVGMAGPAEEVIVGFRLPRRKRGQARVQLVQPFSPWMQLSGPSSSSRWNGR